MPKKTKADDPKELIEGMRKDLQRIIDEDFNYKELRQAFVDCAGSIFEMQVDMLNLWDQQRADFEKVATKVFKEIKNCNDRDFQLAEKNFQTIDKTIDELNHQAARAEAGATMSMLYSLTLIASLGKKDILKPKEEFPDVTIISKKPLNFIRDFFGFKPKEFREIIAKLREATAAA